MLRTIGRSPYRNNAAIAGTVPMRSNAAMRNASSASAGLSGEPDYAQDDSARVHSSLRQDAERDAGRNAQGQRNEYEQQMLPCQPRRVRTEEHSQEGPFRRFPAAGGTAAGLPVRKSAATR